jgi:hypothetical protein
MLLQYVYDLVHIIFYAGKVSLNQHPLLHVDELTSLLLLIVGNVNHKNILILLLLLMKLLRRDVSFLDPLRHDKR